MTSVGYIGLGIMGASMARNLLRAGFDLHVWNRTASKMDDLANAGARRRDSPADVGRHVKIVCINVTDTHDVEAVLFGPHGVIHGAAAGTIVVDHSTIRPDRTREFARRLADKQVILLDAPVSGGDVGARNATLSVMVGGDTGALQQVMPILRAVSKTVTHVGESGAGQVCKACNQIAVLTTLAGVCEAIAFARANGLDVRKMVEVVGAGAGASWQIQNLGPKIASNDFAPGFMVDLALKDLGIVRAITDANDLRLAAIASAHDYLQWVKSAGFGGEGTQAMIRAVGAMHGA